MKFIAYSLAALLASTSAFAASKSAPETPECSYKIGDQVTFLKPADYIATAKANQKAMGAAKGEFETTTEYNLRMADALKTLAIKPVVLEHPANHDHPESGVTYQADYQRFRIFVGAFIGMLEGYDYRYMDKVILDQALLSQDTYVASNSYGNQATVRREEWDVISIKSWNTFPKSIYWKLDPFDGEGGYSVTINVPIEEAKTFKSRFVTGIEFLPKPPFFSTDTDHLRPKMTRPVDITFNHQQFDGQVLCAVLADKDGKVLKTVMPKIE